MIKYGLISETDGRTLEKTIDLICDDFAGHIHVTEIGIYSGETGNGIREYIESKDRIANLTAVENSKDREPIRYGFYNKYIAGDSSEVYNQIEDNSQHLIFVDGCHCFAHVVSDFFCYAPKIKVGGFIAFHDTGKHIKPMKDFQHGDKSNPDAYISVRKALEYVGLLITDDQWIDKYGRHRQYRYSENWCWELIFDEADETNEAGGICVFKKLY